MSAPSLDVESVSSLVSVLAGPQSAWPDEAQIALDAERAVVAGQEVRPVGFTLSYGSKAIALERIQIGDAGSDLAVAGQLRNQRLPSRMNIITRCVRNLG